MAVPSFPPCVGMLRYRVQRQCLFRTVSTPLASDPSTVTAAREGITLTSRDSQITLSMDVD